MKKTGRVLLIIALCCVIIGTTMTVMASVMIRTRGIGWVDERNTYPARLQSYELNAIANLELELVNERVTIVRGGDTVRIEWSQRYDSQYDLSASEGGTLRLTRNLYGGSFRWGPFDFNFEWLNSWLFGWGGGGIEDGAHRPVTVTIPEEMDLRYINLKGVDIRVMINNIDARSIEIDGVNAVVTFRHDDISEHYFRTNGVGSRLRVDGRTESRVGGGSYGSYHAAHSVKVSGVNAELEVITG